MSETSQAEPERYPPFVASEEERRRWDVAAAIARLLFGDVDEASVWYATRAYYRAPWPTGGDTDD
jgi:hypothetical protein